MASLSRPIAILQLFEDGQSVWTVEQISQKLGISASTAYRHVGELVKSGFLDPVTGAGYALGPAFIRYDRVLRQSDPLIHVAEPVMRTLLKITSQNCTVVLCRRFKDCVMSVHEIRGAAARGHTSYERGVARPMFLGATSKVILAHLPTRTLRSIYLSNEKAIRPSLKTGGWKEFNRHLREIRQQGFSLTESEVAKRRLGLAAPIMRNGQVIGSLSLIADSNGLDKKTFSGFVTHVVEAAAHISRSLTRESPVVPR
ncbi:MAG: IclR family transcriptional regulator C-terminal domain-containing protein [Rhodospirillaceae bacterium]|nr:IclR family transcriptional regulator C-terminal domain-containing protein [Rhodospirillaceae bacterium]